MYRNLTCSLCGASVQRGEQDNRESPHVNIECGTWNDLLREFNRMHNLDPEGIESVLRTVIRAHDLIGKGKWTIAQLPENYQFKNGGNKA